MNCGRRAWICFAVKFYFFKRKVGKLKATLGRELAIIVIDHHVT